jgi:hypothetical protein
LKTAPVAAPVAAPVEPDTLRLGVQGVGCRRRHLFQKVLDEVGLGEAGELGLELVHLGEPVAVGPGVAVSST